MESFWTQQTLMRTLYRRCLESVCERYRMTSLEMDILLFLYHNPKFNTASQIVEVRQLSKSHVSISLRDLESKGYLSSVPSPEDRRMQLLSLTEKAKRALRDGMVAQEKFMNLMLEGFSDEERAQVWKFVDRMCENLQKHEK